MTHTLADLNPEPSRQHPRSRASDRPFNRFVARGLTIAAILLLVGVVVFEAQCLWREWTQLQHETGLASHSAVIGYRDISPSVTYAVGPNDWFRREGDQSLLWAKWEAGAGHQWFRFTRGDIDRTHLVKPASAFVSRPIDYPIIEMGRGDVWHGVPLESQVVGYTLQGVKCVYPVLVLSKVQVVNDIVLEHPFLVVVNLFAPPDKAYSIYDANHDGHRLTMAATGYFHERKPLLYDRGTQSLWVEEKDSLTAIAGKCKRLHLARVARLTPVTWQTWLSQNQTSRLLVGADRTRGVPSE